MWLKAGLKDIDLLEWETSISNIQIILYLWVWSTCHTSSRIIQRWHLEFTAKKNKQGVTIFYLNRWTFTQKQKQNTGVPALLLKPKTLSFCLPNIQISHSSLIWHQVLKARIPLLKYSIFMDSLKSPFHLWT